MNWAVRSVSTSPTANMRSSTGSTRQERSPAAILINPGAFTHTSVAILDALNTFEGPVIEVHISNIHKREAFRHHSYVSMRADGVIAGCGTQGYSLGLRRVRATDRQGLRGQMGALASIAVVGAGAIGRSHVGAIAASGTARLHAIVDPSEAARGYAASLGVPSFATLDEMLARSAPQGVILATPNPLHAEGAMACIRAGVPVLVEKPITTDVASARSLVRAAEEARRAARRRPPPPTQPADRRRQGADRGGRARPYRGGPRHVLADQARRLFRHALAPPTRRGPGADLNLIHDIDLLRHLVGEVAAVRAIASSMPCAATRSRKPRRSC